MTAALVVFENERNRHKRVFQPRLENLDDLRHFEGKNLEQIAEKPNIKTSQPHRG